MKITRYEPVTVNISPGDKVMLSSEHGNQFAKVTRLTQNRDRVYAVFDNHTWRPITSYDYTWWKVDGYVEN